MEKRKWMVEDKGGMKFMKCPALGKRWDAGGEYWRQMVEEKENMEVLNPPALEERLDGADWREMV